LRKFALRAPLGFYNQSPIILKLKSSSIYY
jgi:hypothetical protein